MFDFKKLGAFAQTIWTDPSLEPERERAKELARDIVAKAGPLAEQLAESFMKADAPAPTTPAPAPVDPGETWYSSRAHDDTPPHRQPPFGMTDDVIAATQPHKAKP